MLETQRFSNSSIDDEPLTEYAPHITIKFNTCLS